MAETATKTKQKQPSALKRKHQSEKRRARNRSYKASVHTSIRALEGALSEKEDNEAVKSKLNKVYSLMDKGVKKGVFKPQKAARTKARLYAKTVK